MLISKGLNINLGYNAGQFASILSRDFFAVNENNIDSKNNSYGKLM